jgi:hypothetical protein
MAAIVRDVEQSAMVGKSLEDQLRFQKRLNSITNRIHSTRDTNEILLNLQDEILGLFDADRITIYVVDGVKKQVTGQNKFW